MALIIRVSNKKIISNPKEKSIKYPNADSHKKSIGSNNLKIPR
jgi:hypothetical protein